METRRDSSWRFDFWLVAGALALYLVHIWRGFYIDEYTSWLMTTLDLDLLVKERLRSGHLPTYFLLLWGWARLAGDSAVMLRLPSMVFVLGAVWCFPKALRTLYGEPVARVGGVFLAVHQLVVWSAQTARPYAPIVLFAVLAFWALARWMRDGRPRDLVWLGLASLAGFAFHALFGLALGAFVMTTLLALAHKPRRAAGALAVMAGAAAVMAAPLLALKEEQTNFEPGGGVFEFKLADGLSGLARVVFGNFDHVWDKELLKYPIWLAAALALAGAAMWQRRQRDSEGDSFRYTVLWIWFLVPFAGLIVAAGVPGTSVLSHERYYISLVPALVILIGQGAVYWDGRLAGRGAWRLVYRAGAPLVLVAPWLGGWLVEGGDGPRQLARQFEEAPDVIIGDLLPFLYEFRDEGVTFLDAAKIPTEEARQRLVEAADDHEALWLMIYNNYESPLDPLAEDPPPPWTAGEWREAGHARAMRLVRSSGE